MNDKLRLAQIFDVQGEFEPTKASIFLKRSGENDRDSFYLANTVVIDATNFLNIQQSNYVAILNEEDEGYTGNGYMSLRKVVSSSPSDEDDYPIIEFPVTAFEEKEYSLIIRGQALEENPSEGESPRVFKVDILLDEIVVDRIEKSFTSGDSTDWITITSNVVFPDTAKHTLGIRIRSENTTFDKMIIPGSDFLQGIISITSILSLSTPFVSILPELLEVISHTESPYITVHMQVYKVNNNFDILDKFFIYDSKNSLDEVLYTDWYNFDIRSFFDKITIQGSDFLQGIISITSILSLSTPFDNNSSSFDADYSEKASLVLSASGTNANNFIVWELIDNDEYQASPSAIKT